VRHALDMPEAEGRITRQQGRGTLICDARASTLELSNQLAKLINPVDTLEARMAIEPALARLAALRGTQADFDKLFEAADASRDARDPISYEKADAAFHRRIAVAARNRFWSLSSRQCCMLRLTAHGGTGAKSHIA
jgi:DNA-binding FadR family transcriptional regulator